MTSPTSSSSPKSESSESSEPDMDELTSSMCWNTLSDETSPPGTTPTDLRIKFNGHYSCQGYTVEGKLCDRDGIDEVQVDKDVGRYCFQHNPENKNQRCRAYNRDGEQCATICSIDAGEVREVRGVGRPICNTHHEWGAKLIDGPRYPAHPRRNKY